MKKIIALLLALALTLSCAAVLAEAAEEKTDMGTIDFGGKFIIKGKIPEGYTLIEEEKMEHVFINALLKHFGFHLVFQCGDFVIEFRTHCPQFVKVFEGLADFVSAHGGFSFHSL